MRQFYSLIAQHSGISCDFYAQLNKESGFNIILIMKLSFIIPVYNAEKYISRCLDSLLDQNEQDYEIICINDGSKDSSLSILNDYATRYPGKFNVLSQENQGIGPSRNTAFKTVRGEYTWFIDNDDCIQANCLKDIFEFLDSFSPDIINIKYICGFYETNPLAKNLQEKLEIKKISQNLAMSLYQDAPWSKIYKTEFLQKNNIQFPNIFGEDTGVTFDLYSKTKEIYSIKQPLYVWLERPASFSHAIFTKKHFETFPLLLSLLREQSKRAPKNLKVYYEALMLNKSLDFLPEFKKAEIPEELEESRQECIKKSEEILKDLPENIYHEIYEFHKMQFNNLLLAKKLKEQEIKRSYENTVSWKITKPVRAMKKIFKRH